MAEQTAPPQPVDITKRVFLNDDEVTQLTAIFDRLIPADDLSPSASQTRGVVFLDHQLGGAYG
ncbi:hypothetical protein [Thioclava sp. GXIMD4215]|uniref:hypothetical protein n=1 Tax=Thioclava sp. GXIMD4215 TaxID=3131928 RepID=UPI00311ADAB6